MKTVLSMFMLMSVAVSANPEVRIKCTVEPRDSSWLSEIIINLEWSGHPMGGLTGYAGAMELKGKGFQNGREIHTIQTEPNFDVVSWSVQSVCQKQFYQLTSDSDIFDRVGAAKKSRFTQKNSDQWERSADLLCERVL